MLSLATCVHKLPLLLTMLFRFGQPYLLVPYSAVNRFAAMQNSLPMCFFAPASAVTCRLSACHVDIISAPSVNFGFFCDNGVKEACTSHQWQDDVKGASTLLELKSTLVKPRTATRSSVSLRHTNGCLSKDGPPHINCSRHQMRYMLQRTCRVMFYA